MPAVAHQPGDLVGGLRRERPEVPLHVVVAQVGVRQPLLGVDEVLELGRVADEEDRRVVADQVVVALFGVELDREAARVAHGVRAAELAGHRREAHEHRGALTRLEEVGLDVLADVLSDLEEAVSAAALGVHHALGHALAVELGHLLDHVVVLKQDRTVGADGQGVLVAGGRDAGVGGRARRLAIAHSESGSFSWTGSAITGASNVLISYRSSVNLPVIFQPQSWYPTRMRPLAPGG